MEAEEVDKGSVGILPGDNGQVVMTKKQMETLRRQISAFSTICSQLVEMHKVMSQQAYASSQQMPNDPFPSGPGFRQPSRQRWTPSPAQLHILERLYEHGNGTPNKQTIKKITSELSQHGLISEMNVYNWFQNRKARAKRKYNHLPLKEGESEVDTDSESYRENKPQIEDEMIREDESAWLGEKTAEAYESKDAIFLMGPEQLEAKLGVNETKHEMSEEGPCNAGTNAHFGEKNQDMVGVKLRSTDQQQCNDSQGNIPSCMLHCQTEADGEADALLMRSKSTTVCCTAHEIPVSNQQASGVMTVLLDGKQWEVPVGVVDVRKMFGDTALLVDTHGHVVPTNDAGITFHPLHASERYSLIRHVEVKQEMSGKESSDPLIDGLYHCSKHIQ
ncbi:WUSCHEL-related homeobox 12 isoform X1 [Cryptomeria japonica]|uniref:WUSCHEL-related homeobox 12 isoform X1 n=1 Tax=Cryptomeria japonica TaxID=3369 RepID=UPI0025AC4080|nr:WUSCHEL-related homeobox 12 isoform X1 [Cryptomeria japonica]XP_057857669.1 WUSCHEL-related homeobox 12 isoform X1 [Cryptomeria japonica]